MTAQIPAERIHLRAEGQPEELREAVALVLTAALHFCEQPETFPAFLASACEYARGDGDGWALPLLRSVTPELLGELEVQIVAGICADFEDAETDGAS
jgi:hypothetical protein